MKYQVSFIKKQVYIVEANSADEAEEAALDMLSADKMAFMADEIEEIKVERIDEYEKSL